LPFAKMLPDTPSVAAGVVVPRPRLPVVESKRNCPTTPAFPKRTVDDAVRPPLNAISVEVEFAAEPKCVGTGVNGNAKPEPPQAEPVPESTPTAESCAHCVAPLPEPETMRFVDDAVVAVIAVV